MLQINLINRLNPEESQERRNQLFGVNSEIRRDEKLFRHPTRQLTSSAKAKEVKDRLIQGAFFVLQKKLLKKKCGLFIMPFFAKLGRGALFIP